MLFPWRDFYHGYCNKSSANLWICTLKMTIKNFTNLLPLRAGVMLRDSWQRFVFFNTFHFHCCTYFLDLWWYYFSVVSVGVDCHLIVSAIWTLTIFGRNPLRNSWPVLSWLLWRALKVERSQQIATVSWGESVNGVVVTSNSVESFIWNWAQGTGSFLETNYNWDRGQCNNVCV